MLGQTKHSWGVFMKRLLAACAAFAALGACTTTATAPAPAATAAMTMPEITIYHLEGRRSERIVWLMEELGLPYKLEFKRGDLAGSAAAIKEVNPAMPVAPMAISLRLSRKARRLLGCRSKILSQRRERRRLRM